MTTNKLFQPKHIHPIIHEEMLTGELDAMKRLQCGNKDNTTATKCAKILAQCMKEKCNDLDKQPLPPRTRTKPLRFHKRIVTPDHKVSFEYEETRSLELHICPNTNIAYVHIYKSAGTYAVQLFNWFCEQVTGTRTIYNIEHVVDPTLKMWTIWRDPSERFISSMFEISRRIGENTTGGISSLVESLNDSGSSNEDVVEDFLKVFTADRNIFDPHLHSQLDFMLGGDNEIYENLNYIVKMEDGDLRDRLLLVFHEMFKENYPDYKGFPSGAKEQEQHMRRNNREMNLSSESIEFFKGLKLYNLNDEYQDKISSLYRWDNQCLRMCGY